MKTKLCITLSFIFLFLFLTGCTPDMANSFIETFSTKTPALRLDYSIINIEKGTATKCILDIRLPDRISVDKIKQIAEFISENEGSGCSPLFLYYFLPNEKPGIDTAWAYSHFNPQLEVKINGLDLETKATLEAKAPQVNENEMGIWIHAGVLPHKIEIRKMMDAYQMTTVYGDGSGETKTLGIKIVDGEERLYEKPMNSFGDYMVIKNNGNLAFYDNKGFIYELQSEQ
jgi:hypothetical protein